MCRMKPKVGTVLDLCNTPRGFGNYGHTPSGKVYGASGNLKNRDFSTFEQKFLHYWVSNPHKNEVLRAPSTVKTFPDGVLP